MMNVTWLLVALSIGNAPASTTMLFEKVKAALSDFDEVVVYSLCPANIEVFGLKPAKAFHEFEILGETKLADMKIAEGFVGEIRKSLSADLENQLFCFEPRHGLRVVRKKQQVDLVICFKCARAHVYIDGKACGSLTIVRDPQDGINKILSAAGIKLAPEAKPK